MPNRDYQKQISNKQSQKLSDHSFRLLVDSVKDYAIFLLDQEGYIQSWNAGAQNIKGYTADEIIGKHFSIFYPEEDLEWGKPAYELKVAAESGRFEDEGWRIRKDGSKFWANVVITAIRDESGNLRGFGKVTRDLTERKRAEEALRQSEEKFRLMVETVKDYAIFLLDASGYITTWNEGAEKIKGYSPQEIIGKHFSIFYTEEDAKAGRPDHNLKVAVQEGQVEDEGWRIRKDGSRFWSDVVITAVKDKSGTLIGFVKVTRDLTERKAAEEQRLQLAREQVARADAEAANRAKDEFLATVSHELRTPLNAILGWARLLSRANLDEQATRTALDTIERNAKSQAQLIEDLLDVSRIISGKLRLSVLQVDLYPIVEAAIDTMRPAADAKNVRLQAILDSDVGLVAGDPDRLQQIFWNLISNAVKFTPKGGRVQINLQRINSHAEVSVNDTGKGITPEFLPYVFDRFRQADSRITRLQGGLGLGLAIVRHLVELHGGTVEVHSPGEGQGATFVVRLPLSVARTSGRDSGAGHCESASTSKESSIECPPPLEGTRVLVVDDQPDALQLLNAILTECKAEVMMASSAKEAFEAFAWFHPDMIISDIGMPNEDGYSLIKKIRVEERRLQKKWTPAIALTAHARVEDRMQALAAGFQTHVAKPVEPNELIAVIAGLLGRPQFR